MNVTAMISGLRRELEDIDQAIHSLEKFALCGRKRRGRPPGWKAAMVGPKLQSTKAPRPRNESAVSKL